MPTHSDTTRHLEAAPIDLEANAMKAIAAFEPGFTVLYTAEEGLKCLIAISCDHPQDMTVNDLYLGKVFL